MQGESIYNRYIPAYWPKSLEKKPEFWFVFQNGQLLTRLDQSGPKVPDHTVLDYLPPVAAAPHYLGDLDQHDCYCVTVEESVDLPEAYRFSGLRSLVGQIEENVFMLAGRAYQIIHWDQLSKFCGRCGAPTRMKEDERAKQCDRCGNVIYPRISPAIIIAILRGDKILLAHNKNFRENMFSVIAGFMEPGEEFEDTAKREVFEEVGIRIKNLRYFASQSWPFPDSLMVGFICEYAGGEIQIDGSEIAQADWFDREHLPEIPSSFSIAGRMIRWFDEGAADS